MYFIYCTTNKENEKNHKYKIGYTKSLTGRKDDFDTSSINLEDWYYIDTISVSDEENARKLESLIHSHFNEYRIKDDREFFIFYDITIVKNFFKKIKSMKTEKIQDGAIKRTGESISNLRKTRELYADNLTRIFLEKIHNAFAAHAKHIWIKIYNDGKSIMYKDDGDGFTASQLKGFAKHDRFHYNEEGPGIYGIGGKDSDRALADYENAEDGISPVHYETSTDGVYQHIMNWKICEKAILYENPEVYCNIKKEHCHKGTIIAHDEITKITTDKLSEVKKNLRFFCSLFKGMEISISKCLSGNNAYETICDYFDPLYLDNVNIEKEGLSTINNGTAYNVSNKTLVDYNNPENKLKFKLISVYFSKEYRAKVEEFENDFGTSNNLSGLYFVYKDTYLSEPIQSMQFKDGLFHAYNRIRILVIFDNLETAKSFGIRSIKTEKIRITGNYSLKKYTDEKDRDFEKIIIDEFNFWSDFDDRQRDIRNTQNVEYLDAIKIALKDKNPTDSVVVTTDVVNADDLKLEVEDNAKSEKSRAEKYKDRIEDSENAKKRFEQLSNEEKNNLNVLYQYCTSYDSFLLKKGRYGIKSGLMSSFENEIDVMPWSMHNHVTSGINEIIRFYDFLKNKEKCKSDTIIKKLNTFVVSCYETKIKNITTENKFVEQVSYSK